MAARKKGLGRGLDALLGADRDALDDVGHDADRDAPRRLSIALIRIGRYQPRTEMDEGALHDLADSIRSQGIMQPILVRPIADDEGPERYEIIAGERRFRAAHLAGLETVPVLVRDVPDENAAIMALIENIQREDLNPLEEARGVQRLLEEFGLTHEQAAGAIGRSRSTTTNLLRLLKLAQPVQTMLLAGDIDMGHARALLALDSAHQVMLATEVAARRLSVRETEKRVGRTLRDAEQPVLADPPPVSDALPANNNDLKRLEAALSDQLGTRVTIRASTRKKGGQLVVAFTDWSHLNALLERQGLAAVLDTSR